MRTILLITTLSLTACAAGPADSDYEELGEGHGSGDGKMDSNRAVKKKMDRMVAILKGGEKELDLPLIARQYELPFEDATHRTVEVVDCKDGLAPIVNPEMIKLIKDYSGDDKGSPSVLEEAGVSFAIQNFGARTYLAETLVDRRVRSEFKTLLDSADEVYRMGVYDDGSELAGTEYIAIEFRALEKAVIYRLDYSEEY